MLGDHQYVNKIKFVLGVNLESAPVVILLARVRVPPHQIYHDHDPDNGVQIIEVLSAQKGILDGHELMQVRSGVENPNDASQRVNPNSNRQEHTNC